MQMMYYAIISHPVTIGYGFWKESKLFDLSVSQFHPLTEETMTCFTKAWKGSTAQTCLTLYSSLDKEIDIVWGNFVMTPQLFQSFFLFSKPLLSYEVKIFYRGFSHKKFYCLSIRWRFLVIFLVMLCSGQCKHYEICRGINCPINCHVIFIGNYYSNLLEYGIAFKIFFVSWQYSSISRKHIFCS